MKKTVILCLILATTFSFSACGKKPVNNSATGTASPVPTAVASTAPNAGAVQSSDASSAPSKNADQAKENKAAPTPLPPSTNKTVVKDSEAPKVYWATENRESNDVAYHLKDCPVIKDKHPAEITWKMVKDIQFRQCPVCNPPQYEGYEE